MKPSEAIGFTRAMVLRSLASSARTSALREARRDVWARHGDWLGRGIRCARVQVVV